MLLTIAPSIYRLVNLPAGNGIPTRAPCALSPLVIRSGSHRVQRIVRTYGKRQTVPNHGAAEAGRLV